MSSQKETNDFAKKLQSAIVAGDVRAVRRLIKGGVDVNSQTIPLNTWYETSVLHHAVSQNKEEIVKLLIVQAKADVNAKNKDGRTPLHLAARSGNAIIVQDLLDAKAEVDRKTNDERTPLHVAAWRGHTEVVRRLVNAGACVNVTDEGEWTPLYWAAKLNYRAIAKILVENGARINCMSNSPKKGFTPLFEALSHGHIGMAKYLIHVGADLNLTTNEGSITKVFLKKNNLHSDTVIDMLNFCVEHGYELSKNDFVCSEKVPCKRVRDWAATQKTEVCSLSHLCRKFIRLYFIRNGDGQCIVGNLRRLPVPMLIKDYLTFEGENLDMLIRINPDK